MKEEKKQLITSLLIFAFYTSLVLITNILMRLSVIKNNEAYEAIGGVLIGFVAIPIFSIVLPLYFAKKWGLDYSFLPKTKKIIPIIFVFVAYIIIFSYSGLSSLLNKQINILDFMIHLISVSLFHITYYPLFAILLFPVIRKNYGLSIGLISTSFLFAIYHLSQFHNFPAGLDVFMQIFLFMDFFILLILYLWSESILFTALTHVIIGAIDFAYKGNLETKIDFIFVEAVIVLFGLLIYMFLFDKRSKFNKDWWIKLDISGK